MATEIQDILTSANVDEEGGAVKRARRSFLITDLDATYNGSTDPAARIKQAYIALTVKQGQRHPTYPTLFCSQRAASVVDLDKVRFDLLYIPLNFAKGGGDQEAPADGAAVEDGYVVAGRTRLEREETYVDRSGDAIELSFTGHPTISVSVPVDRQRRQLVMERSILTATPGAFGVTYAGKTNNATWQSGAAGTWRCESVDFDQINPSASNGDSGPETFSPLYRIRFEFAYNPNGWNPIVVYTDPETGSPIAGWDAVSAASDTVDIYEQISFASLPT